MNGTQITLARMAIPQEDIATRKEDNTATYTGRSLQIPYGCKFPFGVNLEPGHQVSICQNQGNYDPAQLARSNELVCHVSLKKGSPKEHASQKNLSDYSWTVIDSTPCNCMISRQVSLWLSR